jgi:tRNA(adenine34) deaminase
VHLVDTDRPAKETATTDRPANETATTDLMAMTRALELARIAGDAGEVPVGAVVVVDGHVVAEAGNERERRHDPTAHAEILALRAAAGHLGTWRLSGATLYVTLEPCLMCGGAAVASRLARVVFATPDPKAGACGSLYNLCADPRLNHEMPVEAGLLGPEAAGMLSSWFAGRRGR